MQAVLDSGMTLTALREHQESESRYFPWFVDAEGGRFKLPDHPERLPLMYTVEAVRTR